LQAGSSGAQPGAGVYFEVVAAGVIRIGDQVTLGM
jgi:MOSC domain-containing protein YiiM